MVQRKKLKFWPDKNTIKEQSNTIRTVGRWGLYFVLIGLIAGLGSIFFQFLCQIGSHFLLDQLAGYRPPAPAGEGDLFRTHEDRFQPMDSSFSALYWGALSAGGSSTLLRRRQRGTEPMPRSIPTTTRGASSAGGFPSSKPLPPPLH